MRKRLLSLLIGLALALGLSPRAAAEAEGPPALSAESAVLLVAGSGLVLFEQDAHTPRPMASTTKIMTALLTLEAAGALGDPVVEIAPEVSAAQVEGSDMGLAAGDRLRLSGLAAGMLLASGNDAANAAACFLDGSLEAFADRMNARARELGLRESRFVTPSGLDGEGHAASACDLALLAGAALENPAFRALCGAQSAQVDFLSPEKTVTYRNHNRLLGEMEGCIGVKTGYTDLAGRCLVSAAERNGVTLIAVTLDDPDDWADHQALMDYGFSRLGLISPEGTAVQAELPVAGGMLGAAPVFGRAEQPIALPKDRADQLRIRVFLPAFCYAPLQAGEQVGWVRYQLGDVLLAQYPLCATAAVPAQRREPRWWEGLFSRSEQNETG